MKNIKMIWITTQFEMLHKYPAAPMEVKFLREEHRHIAHLKVWIEVTHNDRDIEFIMFKRFVETLLKKKYDYKSLEMISDELYGEINKVYPNREVWIEISEDGENGTFKQYCLIK